jgi:hypothetical protein
MEAKFEIPIGVIFIRSKNKSLHFHRQEFKMRIDDRLKLKIDRHFPNGRKIGILPGVIFIRSKTKSLHLIGQ